MKGEEQEWLRENRRLGAKREISGGKRSPHTKRNRLVMLLQVRRGRVFEGGERVWRRRGVE